MSEPAALPAFVHALKGKLRADIPVIEIDVDINDPQFAQATVTALLEIINHKDTKK